MAVIVNQSINQLCLSYFVGSSLLATDSDKNKKQKTRQNMDLNVQIAGIQALCKLSQSSFS